MGKPKASTNQLPGPLDPPEDNRLKRNLRSVRLAPALTVPVCVCARSAPRAKRTGRRSRAWRREQPAAVEMMEQRFRWPRRQHQQHQLLNTPR